MDKAILCRVSFACNKMQNQIFELPEVRKSALFLKGIETGKRRWRDSRSIKCLNAKKQPIDYETNFSRTCGNVWEMSSDAAKKTMESNCRLECSYEFIPGGFIPRDSDQGFITRIWLDYENKTRVSKTKENEKA